MPKNNSSIWQIGLFDRNKIENEPIPYEECGKNLRKTLNCIH